MAKTRIDLSTQGATGSITYDLFADGAVGASAIASESISNGHIATDAAIAYSKLALSLSIVDGDISTTAAIADGKLAESYIKADGTRPFVSDQSMGGFKLTNVANGVDAQDAVTKAQLDAVTSTVTTFEWQPSVLSATLLTPPGSPAQYDRYLINGVGTGAWAGHDYAITEWDGAQWVFTAPVVGMFVSSDSEPNKLYLYGGAAWDSKYFEATTASTGLVKVGFDIQLAASAAGGGLTFSAGALSVGAGSAINVNADSVDVKYDATTIKLNGSNQLYVDQAALTAVNAATLDGIDSLSFLRSDASDSYTAGTLTFNSGTLLVTAAGSTLNVAGNFQIAGATMTASAAELNLLDGALVTTQELNALGTIVVREIPTGVLDGVNTVFTLANSPMSGTEEIFVNGILQDFGALNDYDINYGTKQITFTFAPKSTDKIRVSYRY